MLDGAQNPCRNHTEIRNVGGKSSREISSCTARKSNKDFSRVTNNIKPEETKDRYVQSQAPG